MSESMIERVARAKWAHRKDVARKAGVNPPLDDWDGELESLREEVRAESRAAIEAMREPTEAMSVAAMETKGQMTYSDVWVAMIGHVLSEKPEDGA